MNANQLVNLITAIPFTGNTAVQNARTSFIQALRQHNTMGGKAAILFVTILNIIIIYRLESEEEMHASSERIIKQVIWSRASPL